MAKISDLNPIDRRNFLHNPKTTTQQLIESGSLLLASGSLYDALQFFLKANHPEGAQQVKQKAVELGDPFTISLIAARDAEGVSKDDWLAAAKVAESKAKFRYAAWAFEEGGDESAAKRTLQKIEAAEPASQNVAEVGGIAPVK